MHVYGPGWAVELLVSYNTNDEIIDGILDEDATATGQNVGFRRGRMRVPPPMLTTSIICHELAHIIADLGPNAGHSRLWSFIFLDLMALFDMDAELAAKLSARGHPRPCAVVPLSDCMRSLPNVTCIRLAPKLFRPGAPRTHRCLMGEWGVAAREDAGRTCTLCGRVAAGEARSTPRQLSRVLPIGGVLTDLWRSGKEECKSRSLKSAAVGVNSRLWPEDCSSIHWHESTREVRLAWEDMGVGETHEGSARTGATAAWPAALQAGGIEIEDAGPRRLFRSPCAEGSEHWRMFKKADEDDVLVGLDVQNTESRGSQVLLASTSEVQPNHQLIKEDSCS